MAPVFTSGRCGSWAQFAAAALESALAIKENRPVGTSTISAQHLIDCDKLNAGCYKGSVSGGLGHMMINGFFFTNDYYYTSILGVQRSCMASSSKNKQIISGMGVKGQRATTDALI